ncbi:hypothetical protein pSf1_0032 [Shigella phage pSf-1]|uniref:Uncharacterized protein n=1 Tax=Shigella phage pSf-1 TaxID=2496551 RepID=M9QT15_9CAUD|nr:hypothetical protein pSf1_0032 [Shigella phage pSf-1]AGI61415.1 hypothetical protein pSf1_0032 [Shigella phage pSf-1]
MEGIEKRGPLASFPAILARAIVIFCYRCYACYSGVESHNKK